MAMDRQARGVALIALAGVLWGLNGLYVRVLASAGLGSLSIVFVRYTCALVAMAPAMSAASAKAHRNILALRPQHLACCVMLGLVCNALGGVLCARSIARVGVSTTTVLLYAAPAIGCLMARMLYAEDLTRQKLAAMACNFAGVLLVVAGGGSLARGGDLFGLAAGLGYALTYALLAVLSKPVAGTCHPLAVVYYGSLTVVLAVALPALGSGELLRVLAPFPLLAALLYGGLSTVVGNIVYQRGMALGVETSRVPVITSVEVAVSACMGVWVLGEPLTAGLVLGVGLVLASIVLMNAHAAPGEAHGVRLVLSAEQLLGAYGASTDLGGAVASVRARREESLSRRRP